MIARARSLLHPITMRSGSIRSVRAQPSRRNSGLLTTSNSAPVRLYRCVRHFFTGLDRHSTLIDDHSIFLQSVSDFAGHSLDVAQIHTTVGVRRRWNRNEDHLGIIDSFLDPGAKA